MFIRSLAALPLLTTLALGLSACGDDKDTTVSSTVTMTTNPTNNPSQSSQSDTSNDTESATEASGGLTEDGTTGIVDPTTGGDTTNSSVTTTTEPPETTSTTLPPETTSSTSLETSSTEPPMTSGSTTDQPPETTTGGGDGAYGACQDMMPACPAESDCVSVMGLEGNFCSPQCMDTADCPPPPSGSAEPMCILTLEMAMDPTNCALICDPMANPDQCPDGSSCKPIQMVGVCTVP